jgi:hypothetical protein
VATVTKTDIRTPADLNSVTSDCDQVFIDLSSARSMRLLCVLPNVPRLRAHVVRATPARGCALTQPRPVVTSSVRHVCPSTATSVHPSASNENGMDSFIHPVPKVLVGKVTNRGGRPLHSELEKGSNGHSKVAC